MPVGDRTEWRMQEIQRLAITSFSSISVKPMRCLGEHRKGMVHVARVSRRISFSRFRDYRQCPRKFYLWAIRALKRELSGHNLNTGVAVHAVISRLGGIPREEWSLELVVSMLDELWPSSGWASEMEERRCRQRAERVLFTYIANPLDRGQVVGNEHELEGLFRSAGLLMTGRLDRVIREDDGSLTVLDYKLGGNLLNNGDITEALEQVKIYAMLYAMQTKEIPSRLSIYNLDVNERHDIEITRDELLALHDQVGQVLNDLAGKWTLRPAVDDFLPRPGVQCHWCEFFNASCEGWGSASRGANLTQEGWEGTARYPMAEGEQV
jgi:hypothetical protein